ncbi:MAG: YbaN family protein [Minwuia sp.]|uniref:YbaN family protein n=1 Tax=Minwuia sp. TaxID=2493630 RepID=UPI003A88DDE1
MTSSPQDDEPPPLPHGAVRVLLIVLGWTCTVVGVAGVILPGLPGVPFLLIAAWAFSRSSRRFHDWLYHHPWLGAPVQDWEKYRAVPRKAKIAAVLVMSSSFALLLWLYGPESFIPWVAGTCMAAVGIWLVTRPNPPVAAESRPAP